MDQVEVSTRAGRHGGADAPTAGRARGGVSTLAEIAVERHGGTVVARLSGEVDMTNAAHVRERAAGRRAQRRAGARGGPRASCRYLDSAAIEVLFDLARRLGRRRQELRLVVPDDVAAAAACWR